MDIIYYTLNKPYKISVFLIIIKQELKVKQLLIHT